MAVVRETEQLNPSFLWITLLCVAVIISIHGTPVPSLAAATIVRYLTQRDGERQA